MGWLPWLPLSAQWHAYTCGSWESCGWRRRGRDAWEKANACESTRRRQLQSSISGYKVIQCLHVVSGLEPRCTFITSVGGGGVGGGGEVSSLDWNIYIKKNTNKASTVAPFSLSKHSPSEQCRFDRRISRLLALLVRARAKKTPKKTTNNDLNEGPLDKLVVQIGGVRFLAFYLFTYLHPVCLIKRDISPQKKTQKW